MNPPPIPDPHEYSNRPPHPWLLWYDRHWLQCIAAAVPATIALSLLLHKLHLWPYNR